MHRSQYIPKVNNTIKWILLLVCLLEFTKSGSSKCVDQADKSTKTNTISINKTGEARILERVCYRGECIEEQCECDAGWAGEYCDQCTGRVLLKDDSGFVSDGPNSYAMARECSWLIQPERKAPVRLTFLEFASECGWDYLYVYDGDSAYSPLLATFNGLLRIQDSSEDAFYPEVVAYSGSVFLHFFSDIAYTMQGFNISYGVERCPRFCTGHGICNATSSESNCECESDWKGAACEHMVCPLNCTENLGQGTCQDQTCVCNSEYQGVSCSASVPPKEGFWDEEDVLEHKFNVARASHTAVLLNETVWIYGGIQFENLSNSDNVFTYDPSQRRWAPIEPLSLDRPSGRYGHSLVTYKQTLLMFGGKELLTGEILDELWEFDIGRRIWTKIDYEYSANLNSTTLNSTSPLTLWGHTATLVQLEGNSSVLIVLFGFHPIFEFSGGVYEYDPVNRLWSIAQTSGANIKPSYGHTSVWDPVTKTILIHGGFRHLTGNAYGIDDAAFSYDPIRKLFKILSGSGVPRYLHSAVVSEGILYVYGGCTHNDSVKSTGKLCFSPSFMAYSIACNTWEHLTSAEEIHQPNRYGHSAVVLSPQKENDTSRMLVFGGYDSTMLDNILVYHSASCAPFKTERSCLDESEQFLSCVWDGTSCMALAESPGDLSCADAKSECGSLSECSTCLNYFGSCAMCDNGCRESCDAGKEVANCSSDAKVYCSRFGSCSQCQHTPGCHWNTDSVCVPGETTDPVSCDASCGEKNVCSDCLDNADCMWCANKGVCISTASYVVQFPYGECMKWVNKKDQCATSETCTSHRTCTNCQINPFCGWCDDGSDTGLGLCQSGAGHGSHDGVSLNVLADSTTMYNASIPACAPASWYFVECPVCQCNGHSKCINDTSECELCQNKTEGEQCETCIDGFFGDATNGGKCQPCDCDGRAVLCNNTSGKCFCSTKGEIGDRCESCDNNAKYFGDPTKNGTCFYRLLINYSFTFTLTTNNDRYVTAINFENTPPLTANAQLSFEAQQPCDVLLAVYRTVPKEDTNQTAALDSDQVTGYEEIVAEFVATTKFGYDFSGSKYGFGDQRTNSTIRIYVRNFTIPMRIQVSLVQRSNSLLMLLLILFSCFLVILLLTALGWKLKMLYDSCQLRRQRAEQLEQMAARPFSSVHLDFEDLYEQKQVLIAGSSIEAVSEEFCADGLAAPISVIMWMPSGNLDLSFPTDEEKSLNSIIGEMPSEHASLAFGTALVSGSDRISNVEAIISSERPARTGSKKMKVVFKRGRRGINEARSSMIQSTSRHSTFFPESGQRPQVNCVLQQNQSNNMPEARTNDGGAPGSDSRGSVRRGRRRFSKNGRSSFTSIRSGSVSPVNADVAAREIPSSRQTRREVRDPMPVHGNSTGDEIAI